MDETKEIYVIIAGTREFKNYDLLRDVCDKILENKSKDHKIIIVSGHARGADTLGEKYASERGYDLRVFPADWDKYKKKAGHIRNEKMADLGNVLIAFFADGFEELSKGTRDMVKVAQKKNLIIREIYERDFKEPNPTISEETNDNRGI